MDKNDLIKSVAGQLELSVRSTDFDAIKKSIIDRINDLIQHDFEKLIRILYRLDVSEEKLKDLLRKNPGTDAGIIITNLVLERQAQKIKTREQFRDSGKDIPPDEKW